MLRGSLATLVGLGRFLAPILLLLILAEGKGAAETSTPKELGDLGWVIFVAGTGDSRSLMMVDSAGEQPPFLLADLPGADTQPAVGPDGQLAWINQNGSDWNLVQDAQVISTGALHLSPTYRPDGTLVAARSEAESTDIFSFENGRRVEIISGQGGLAVSPAFSADGQSLAYVSDENGLGQIFLAPAIGGAGKPLEAASQVLSTDPAWSPTGEQLVFVRGETDIYTIKPDGSGLTQLTENKGVNRRPFFSPDGKKIVFASTRDKDFNRLIVMDLESRKEHILLPAFNQPQSMPIWVPKSSNPTVDKSF